MNIFGNSNLAGVAGVAGVMAWPVAHAPSPGPNDVGLEKYRMDGVPIPLPVAPGHFAQTLRVLSLAGFAAWFGTGPEVDGDLIAQDTQGLA